MTETEKKELPDNEKTAEIKIETKDIDCDGMVKEIIENIGDKKVIEFINSIFNMDLNTDSPVVHWNPETHNDKLEKQQSDFYLKIGERFFHMEIQSYNDNSMIFRMVEYGVRGALSFNAGNVSDDDTVELTIPEPVVIFLRKNETTYHKKFTIKLNLPGKDNTAQYECGVRYVNDYTAEELIEKKLFPLVPFYNIRYERMLSRKHTKADEEKMLGENLKIAEMIKEAMNSGELPVTMASFITNSMMVILKTLVERAKKVEDREGVEKTMENVREIFTVPDYFGTIRKYEAIGEARGEMRGEIIGRARGLAGALKELGHSKEEAISMIIKKCKLSSDDAQKYADDVWNEEPEQ